MESRDRRVAPRHPRGGCDGRDHRARPHRRGGQPDGGRGHPGPARPRRRRRRVRGGPALLPRRGRPPGRPAHRPLPLWRRGGHPQRECLRTARRGRRPELPHGLPHQVRPHLGSGRLRVQGPPVLLPAPLLLGPRPARRAARCGAVADAQGRDARHRVPRPDRGLAPVAAGRRAPAGRGGHRGHLPAVPGVVRPAPLAGHRGVRALVAALRARRRARPAAAHGDRGAGRRHPARRRRGPHLLVPVPDRDRAAARAAGRAPARSDATTARPSRHRCGTRRSCSAAWSPSPRRTGSRWP